MELTETHIPGVTVHPYEKLLEPFLYRRSPDGTHNESRCTVNGPLFVDRECYGYGPLTRITGEQDSGYVYLTATGKFSTIAQEYVGSDYDADMEDSANAGAESLQVAWANIDRDAELEPDVTTCRSGEPQKAEPDLFMGYDVLDAYAKQYRCWYCDGSISYAEYQAAMPQATSEEDKQRSFCYEFLAHYDECKAAHNGLPVVRTWWQGERLRIEGYASPSVLKKFRVKDSV
jgi:hypothetical protein